MPANISDDLKWQIETIYNQEQKIDRFYMFDQIPPKKLANAKSSYAFAMTPDETVIFLQDDNFFGGAKDGFVLTTKHLFYKNYANQSEPVWMEVSDIVSVTYKQAVVNNYIVVFLNDNTLIEILIAFPTDKHQRQACFNVMEKTIQLLKGRNASKTQAQTPAGQERVVECPGCTAKTVLTTAIGECEWCGSPLQ